MSSVSARLKVVEHLLKHSELERERLELGIDRLCDFLGVDFNMVFKSESLFDWDKFENKEEKVKSKEKLPPIAHIDGKLKEEKQKKADEYE